MSVTWEAQETFTGERDGKSVDDILVKFTSDDPVWELTRQVLCSIKEGVYDPDDTIECIKILAEGLERNLAEGISEYEPI